MWSDFKGNGHQDTGEGQMLSNFGENVGLCDHVCITLDWVE